jgi:hypothetical protein
MHPVRFSGLIAKRWSAVCGVLLIAALGCVLAFTVVDGLLWKREPPQIVTLPNGEKYQFAGTKYTTTPVPPSLAARAVSWLPVALADRARKRFAASLSQNRPGAKFPSPQLVVWFRRLGTNGLPAAPRYNPSVMLADQASVVAGHDGLAGYPTGTAWLFAAFSIVPRRSRELECHFYRVLDHGLIGKVSFLNPLYGQFPQWQPEPLPMVKRVEDLEVRLDRLETGYPPPQGYGTTLTPLEKPMFRLGPERGISDARASVFDISLRSSAGYTTWVLRDAELWDATGNRLFDSLGLFTQPLLTDWQSGYSKLMQGTLWPDEAAWRLKLEFNCAAGLATGVLVTFSNVPVLKAGTTKSLKRTAALGPYQVVLEETMLRSQYEAWVLEWRLELLKAPSGLTAQIIRATVDPGVQVTVRHVTQPRPGSGSYSVEQFDDLLLPGNATAVDVTCAIQKQRMVEFLVKPPKPL